MYKYSKTPDNKRIVIESDAPLSLEEVIRFLDSLDDSIMTSILRDVHRELKLQLKDPEWRNTTFGGRDPKIDTFVLSKDELAQMGKINRSLWPRFLEYRYKFKIYPRKKIVNPFPIVVGIEPTSVCNLKCQMCFQSDASFYTDKVHLGKMDLGFYRQIVDELEENGCDAVVFASRGEPTLHPRFGDMVAYATERVLDVKINTNATRLNDELCHKILEANPSLVVFSIDSASPLQFEEIRKGAKFETVLRNVIRFRDIRARFYPRSRVVTRVSATIFREDQDQDLIHSFWSGYVDQVAVHPAIPLWDSYGNPLSEVTDPCGMLWERLYIWWNGLCSPCDVDYKSVLSIGRVDDHSSIKDVWLGKRAQMLRDLHQRGRKNSQIPCNRCAGSV